MHSLGRDCHFNLSFRKRFPLCMQAKVRRYLSTTWEMGYIFWLYLLAIRRQACTLFFLHSRIRNFRSGPGHFCAYDMFSCWKWTSNRLEAGKEMFNHLGWEAYWIGQAGMAIGVAVGALHGKASYT
jgi:hypothetical protein